MIHEALWKAITILSFVLAVASGFVAVAVTVTWDTKHSLVYIISILLLMLVMLGFLTLFFYGKELPIWR